MLGALVVDVVAERVQRLWLAAQRVHVRARRSHHATAAVARRSLWLPGERPGSNAAGVVDVHHHDLAAATQDRRIRRLALECPPLRRPRRDGVLESTPPLSRGKRGATST